MIFALIFSFVPRDLTQGSYASLKYDNCKLSLFNPLYAQIHLSDCSISVGGKFKHQSINCLERIQESIYLNNRELIKCNSTGTFIFASDLVTKVLLRSQDLAQIQTRNVRIQLPSCQMFFKDHKLMLNQSVSDAGHLIQCLNNQLRIQGKNIYFDAETYVVQNKTIENLKLRLFGKHEFYIDFKTCTVVQNTICGSCLNVEKVDSKVFYNSIWIADCENSMLLSPKGLEILELNLEILTEQLMWTMIESGTVEHNTLFEQSCLLYQDTNDFSDEMINGIIVDKVCTLKGQQKRVNLTIFPKGKLEIHTQNSFMLVDLQTCSPVKSINSEIYFENHGIVEFGKRIGSKRLVYGYCSSDSVWLYAHKDKLAFEGKMYLDEVLAQSPREKPIEIKKTLMILNFDKLDSKIFRLVWPTCGITEEHGGTFLEDEERTFHSFERNGIVYILRDREYFVSCEPFKKLLIYSDFEQEEGKESIHTLFFSTPIYIAGEQKKCLKKWVYGPHGIEPYQAKSLKDCHYQILGKKNVTFSIFNFQFANFFGNKVKLQYPFSLKKQSIEMICFDSKLLRTKVLARQVDTEQNNARVFSILKAMENLDALDCDDYLQKIRNLINVKNK